MQTKSDSNALANAESLLAKLKEARQDFETWNAAQSKDLPELRQQWLRSKPRDGVGREMLQWKSEDPALLAMTEVNEVKRHIATLKMELRKAEDKLEALETEGSPRDVWERALLDAEAKLHGITTGLPGSRLREHLVQ
jgi:hypothetical protein